MYSTSEPGEGVASDFGLGRWKAIWRPLFAQLHNDPIRLRFSTYSGWRGYDKGFFSLSGFQMALPDGGRLERSLPLIPVSWCPTCMTFPWMERWRWEDAGYGR